MCIKINSVPWPSSEIKHRFTFQIKNCGFGWHIWLYIVREQKMLTKART
jgi:hypothetical protein